MHGDRGGRIADNTKRKEKVHKSMGDKRVKDCDREEEQRLYKSRGGIGGKIDYTERKGGGYTNQVVTEGLESLTI